MNDDTTTRPTRRTALKYGGTVVAGGLLAGCSGGDAATTPTTTAGGYEACIEPTGCLTFESVPRDVRRLQRRLGGRSTTDTPVSHRA